MSASAALRELISLTFMIPDLHLVPCMSSILHTGSTAHLSSLKPCQHRWSQEPLGYQNLFTVNKSRGYKLVDCNYRF